MVLQLPEAVAEEYVIPVEPELVNHKSLLEAFQCQNCFIKTDCFIEQVVTASGQSDSERKNKQLLIKDTHVFYAGDHSAAVYVIHSGSVKTYVITEDGEEQVMGFYFAGDVLGLDALGGNSHIVSADTLETTSICKLPLTHFRSQEVIPRFFNLISAQQAHDYDLLLMLASKNSDGRMASFLVSLSKRFHTHGYSENEYNLSMCRHDIASYLGLTIETVSRTLRRFRDTGLLEISRRKVRILDMEGLRKIAGRQISG